MCVRACVYVCAKSDLSIVPQFPTSKWAEQVRTNLLILVRGFNIQYCVNHTSHTVQCVVVSAQIASGRMPDANAPAFKPGWQKESLVRSFLLYQALHHRSTSWEVALQYCDYRLQQRGESDYVGPYRYDRPDAGKTIAHCEHCSCLPALGLYLCTKGNVSLNR